MEELRKKDEWRPIPVVVLTAKDITDSERARLQGFATAVLLKQEQSQDALIRDMRELIQRAVRSEVSA
jgi:CheY-like chemotaxis protein